MSQGAYKLSDGTNTVAIPASPTADDATMATQPEVRSANFTARIGAVYHVTASATVTDPTPVEGRGYNVFVINGTATVGSLAYARAGTFIRRRYHSGAWSNIVTLPLSTVITDATGARTIANSDMGQYVRLTNASANALTVPTNASVPIPSNAEFYFRRGSSAGACSLVTTGVTVNGSANISSVGQGQNFALKKIGTDEWDFI